jgi:hypothetical protein
MRRTNSLTQQRTSLTCKNQYIDPNRRLNNRLTNPIASNSVKQLSRENNREQFRDQIRSDFVEEEENIEVKKENRQENNELMERLERLEKSTLLNDNILKKIDEIGDKISDSLLGSREMVNSLVNEHRNLSTILNDIKSGINIIASHTPSKDLEIQVEIKEILECIKNAVVDVSSKNQKVIDSVNNLNETFSTVFNIPVHRRDQISESHEQFIFEIRKLYNTYTETHKLSETNTRYLGDIQNQLNDLISIMKSFNFNKSSDTSEIVKLKTIQQNQFYKFSKILCMYQTFVSRMYSNDNNKELNELSNIITDFTNNFSPEGDNTEIDYVPLNFD